MSKYLNVFCLQKLLEKSEMAFTILREGRWSKISCKIDCVLEHKYTQSIINSVIFWLNFTAKFSAYPLFILQFFWESLLVLLSPPLEGSAAHTFWKLGFLLVLSVSACTV